MKNDFKAALASLGMFAIALAVLFISFRLIPADRSTHTDIAAAINLLSIIDVALLVFLLYSYVKSYLEVKSRFALGLVGFLFGLMLFTLTSNRLVLAFLGLAPIMQGPGPQMGVALIDIVPLVFSTIALAVLAYLSNE